MMTIQSFAKVETYTVEKYMKALFRISLLIIVSKINVYQLLLSSIEITIPLQLSTRILLPNNSITFRCEILSSVNSLHRNSVLSISSMINSTPMIFLKRKITINSTSWIFRMLIYPNLSNFRHGSLI